VAFFSLLPLFPKASISRITLTKPTRVLSSNVSTTKTSRTIFSKTKVCPQPLARKKKRRARWIHPQFEAKSLVRILWESERRSV
jgi:hypothetical protein